MPGSDETADSDAAKIARSVVERLPLTRTPYRGLTALALPAADALLRRRLKQGKEHGARLPSGAARPGSPAGRMAPAPGPHSASVGELVSILPLIERSAEA